MLTTDFVRPLLEFSAHAADQCRYRGIGLDSIEEALADIHTFRVELSGILTIWGRSARHDSLRITLKKQTYTPAWTIITVSLPHQWVIGDEFGYDTSHFRRS
jgi:hypothetical protein